MMVMMNQIVVKVMRTILQMNNDDSVNGGIDDDDNKDDYDSDAENNGVSKVVLRWRHFLLSYVKQILLLDGLVRQWAK